MTNSDLFNADPNQVTNPEDGKYLESLVGDGKTYKDPELLAKAAWYKEQHIKKIEAENAQIRAELEKRANSEDFVNKIMEKLGTREQPSNPNPQGQVQQPQTQQPDVAQIAREIFNQEQQKSKENSNVTFVMSELERLYGSNFAAHIEQKRANLGVSKEFANQLAAKEPKAFIEMFKPDPKVIDNSHVPPRGYGSPSGPNPQNGHKTWKDYERIRQTDRKLYESADMQMTMMKDALALKEDFYK